MVVGWRWRGGVWLAFGRPMADPELDPNFRSQPPNPKQPPSPGFGLGFGLGSRFRIQMGGSLMCKGKGMGKAWLA